MSRESLRLHATSILELIAWGEAAEQANAGLVARCEKAELLAEGYSNRYDADQLLLAEKDATIDRLLGEAEDDQHSITIQANEINRLADENERLKAELALRSDRDMFTAWWTQDKP